MRMRLVGYSGARPPVPGTEVVAPEDPEPAPETPPDEIPQPLILVLNDGDEFHKGDYLAMGYNRFDVMCIGGAGGRGGRITESFVDSFWAYEVQNVGPRATITFNNHRRAYGGAGGGGGVQRLKGRLALLPSLIEVGVGAAGADGADSTVNLPFHDWKEWYPGGESSQSYSSAMGYPALPTPPPGGDGGASFFGTLCQASGGKGAAGFNGGPGGIGGRLVAGGAVYPTKQVWIPPQDGSPVPGGYETVALPDGQWDGKIGSGGKGGSGFAEIDGPWIFRENTDTAGAPGIYYFPSPRNWTTAAGGLGASSSDHSVESTVPAPVPNVAPIVELHRASRDDIWVPSVREGLIGTINLNMPPVPGGGAKPFLINGETESYGTKAGGRDGKGAVIVRLSYAIV